jgi:hypothetical protein
MGGREITGGGGHELGIGFLCREATQHTSNGLTTGIGDRLFLPFAAGVR